MTKESFVPNECELDEGSHGELLQESQEAIARGGVATPFPWKLHEMLDDASRNDREHIVSWQSHGRSFTVHKPKEFVEKIMPTYFNQTKYASFQRQLNLYGFCRLTQGADKGAYFHECFVRGEQGLCRGMVRRKIKGTKVRRTMAPEEEPNFYSPEWGKRKLNKEQNLPPFSGTPASAPHMKIRTLNLLQTALPTATMSELGKDSRPSVVSEESSSDSDESCETDVERAPVLKTRSLSRKHKISEAQSHGSANGSSHPPLPTKGGDLLYFEGRPFHYLEHLDHIPPIPILKISHQVDTLHTILPHTFPGVAALFYS